MVETSGVVPVDGGIENVDVLLGKICEDSDVLELEETTTVVEVGTIVTVGVDVSMSELESIVEVSTDVVDVVCITEDDDGAEVVSGLTKDVDATNDDVDVSNTLVLDSDITDDDVEAMTEEVSALELGVNGNDEDDKSTKDVSSVEIVEDKVSVIIVEVATGELSKEIDVVSTTPDDTLEYVGITVVVLSISTLNEVSKKELAVWTISEDVSVTEVC